MARAGPDDEGSGVSEEVGTAGVAVVGVVVSATAGAAWAASGALAGVSKSILGRVGALDTALETEGRTSSEGRSAFAGEAGGDGRESPRSSGAASSAKRIVLRAN
jgi:hypothetical protein